MDERLTTQSPRQRLIEAAIGAFLVHGYAAARLDLIAREAGISKKTIYKHVASKLELYSLAVEDRIRRAGSSDLLLDPESGEEPKAALRRFLLAAAALALSPEGLAAHRLVMRDSAQFPELVEAHNRPIMPMVENLAAWLAAQTRRGWLAVASPERAALLLFELVLGAERRAARVGVPPPDAAAQARLVDEALDLFLYGVIARPAGG